MGLGREGHGPFCAGRSRPRATGPSPNPRFFFSSGPSIGPWAPQPLSGSPRRTAFGRPLLPSACGFSPPAPGPGRRGGLRRRVFWETGFLCPSRGLRVPGILGSSPGPFARPRGTEDSAFTGLRPVRNRGWRKTDGRALAPPSRRERRGYAGCDLRVFGLVLWGRGLRCASLKGRAAVISTAFPLEGGEKKQPLFLSCL